MKIRQPTIEQAGFIFIFLFGLMIRFWELGAQPLTDHEAQWALSALDLARGNHGYISSSVGYHTFTGLLFWIFGANNFLARFWTAISGSLLILSPYLFRRYLGNKTALILAFGLAFDPIMIHSSRSAMSALPSLTFGLLLIGSLMQKYWSLLGIFTGLYLLSGSDAVQGLLLACLTGIAYLVMEQTYQKSTTLWTYFELKEWSKKPGVKEFSLSILIVFITLGTLFLIVPEGVSGVVEQSLEYYNRFVHSLSIPFLRILFALVVYQPIPFFLGVIGLPRQILSHRFINNLRNDTLLGLLFFFFALLLIAVKSGRGMFDLIWISIPLWLWASQEISGFIPLKRKISIVSVLLAGVIFIVLCVLWLHSSSLSQKLGIIQMDYLDLAIYGAFIFLVILCTWLVASGWTIQIARLGVLWGILFGLGLYTLANIGSIVNFLPSINEIEHQELLYDYPLIGQANLLDETLGELSLLKTNQRNLIDIQVMVESPALKWMLRDFTRISYIPEYLSPVLALDEETNYPSIILTWSNQEFFNMPTVYRGQDFIWYRSPSWSGIFPPQLLNWLIFRDAPWLNEEIILWTLNDVFPDNSGIMDMGIIDPDINIEPASVDNNP